MLKVHLLRFLQRFIVALEYACLRDDELLEVLERAAEVKTVLENGVVDVEKLASFESDLQLWLSTGRFAKSPELEKAANQLASVFLQIQEA